MKRALLVIDVQNEYFGGKLTLGYPENSLDYVLKAIDGANAHNIPVVVIQHTALAPDSPIFRKGSHEWELHPEIVNRPYHILIGKRLPSCFTGTNLEEWLKENRINTLVIAGYMSQHACDITAKQAYHMGYKVEFLSDATGTLDLTNSAGSVKAEELHRAVLVGLQFRVAQVMNTEAWLEKIKLEPQTQAA
jgi:nicotinamidase-related amidase